MPPANDRAQHHRAGVSAGTDGQQNLTAECVFDLLEIQRGFALIAQHFEHGWAAFFRNFDSTVIELDHVHLKCLDLKISCVPAVGARQCHASSSSLLQPQAKIRAQEARHLL